MSLSENTMTELQLVAVRLRTERRIEPLGIDHAHPWLSWHITGSPGLQYGGYQVQTSSGPEFAHPTWDSGHVDDPAPGIRFGGQAPRSRELVHWRVRAYTVDGRPGPWSAPASFEMGLLEDADWAASWISIAADTTGTPVYLTTQLTVPEDATRARLYVSALGWVRVLVDDTDLTEGLLVPRFTPYDDEVEYLTFALDAITPGPHRLSLVVGDGRFRGALGIHGIRNVYGDRIGALAQAEFLLPDGTISRAVTDGSWTGGHGARIFADPKDGETIDLTRATGAGALREPSGVVVLPPHPRRLVAEQTEPLRRVRELAPQKITTHPDGTVLVDFGQNIAGIVRLRAHGLRGTRVVLQHGEDLGKDGRIEWEHLDREGAKRSDRPRRFQRDEIILDGTVRWAEPWFTIHGFRYVEITGLDTPPTPADILAVVLSSVDVDPDAFTSSDPLLNQLHRNIAWSMTGNFLDTPTDCPQRERGGFTGDAQVFAPTATNLADVSGYFGRYLRSLSIDQLDDGRIPMIIPKECSPFSGPPKGMTLKASGSVGWGDAAVLLPWALYQTYGDTDILTRQYDSMVAWVDYLHRGGARRGFIWGEWIRAGGSTILGAIRDNSTNRKNIGLAYLAHSAGLLARIADVLQRADDAARYAGIAGETVRQWRRIAIRRGGARIGSDHQDDYVRALAFDLLPTPQRARAATRLAELVERSGHIGTGFLSTSMLLPVLADTGHRDLAYRLLLQQTPPSWLGQVARGATTIWENWEEPGKKGHRVGSSNHYAFGSVGSWIVSGVVGLSATSPGRRHFRFDPRPEPGFTHAGMTVATDFGPVTASWRVEGDDLVTTLGIPHGVTIETIEAHGPLLRGAGSHQLRRPLVASR